MDPLPLSHRFGESKPINAIQIEEVLVVFNKNKERKSGMGGLLLDLGSKERKGRGPGGGKKRCKDSPPDNQI